MALINCYRYEKSANKWSRTGSVYKIRAGGVPGGQPLGFDSFRLQRLLIAIGTEFAKLNAQFRGHMDSGMLNAAIRGVITEAGLQPSDAPEEVKLDNDDVGSGKYAMRLLIIDGATNANQGLAVGVTSDGTANPTCVSCGLAKARPKMDPKVKSHSVIPASFWEAIVPSALAAVGVDKAATFSTEDQVLKNSMINAGNEAAGTFQKPGADAQAISMCSDCESRQADFSLLQRHEKGERWLRNDDNRGKEAVIRSFIGTQFLAQSTGIGDRNELTRVTYNVARRVASAFERLIVAALERYIRSLGADTPAKRTPAAHKTPLIVSSTKFGTQDQQQTAMKQQVLPQMRQQVQNKSFIGATFLEAQDFVARISRKAHQHVTHISLWAGLEVAWSTFPIDDTTPLKARLEQIGTTHGAHRAQRRWRGGKDEPPLAVFLAQDIDEFLRAVVEMAVLFCGLRRRDQTKDEKGGVVKA
jgi:hypothetical protein